MKNDLPKWRVDNIVPFVILIGTFFAYLNRTVVLETKLDTVIENQKQLSRDFTDWKRQAETRLGSVESTQTTVVSHLQSHLNIKIH